MFKIFLFSLFLLNLGSSVLAFNSKVLKIRGKASAKYPGKKPFLLKKGSVIKGNALVATRKKSFVLIQTMDGSRISLGPNGKIVLSQKDKSKPTLVELLKGKIRGQVSKLAKPKEGYEHKMILKTRSASLGVRGTDFVVVYNPKNHITSNITLKGEVDIYKKPDEEIYESIREEFDEGGRTVVYSQGNQLENEADQLKHYSVKSIKKGKFSGAFPSYEEPLSSVKISPLQAHALQKNQGLNEGKKGNILTGDYNLKKDYNKNDFLVPSPQRNTRIAKNKYNSVKQNEDGVRPGGNVDLNTGIYIAPPSGAKWDKDNQIYLMPKGLGGVDSQTGSYIPPEGVRLDPLNGFVATSKKYGKRDVQKNLKKLRNLTGSFNEQLSQALGIFKEITRADLIGSANYKFTTNVLENYYGEYLKISNAPSMLWDLDGFAGFQLFHSKRWLIYPKGSLGMRWHERSINEVKEHNSYRGMLGWENHFKHNLFGKKARLIADIQFETIYKDYRKRNLFDFYSENSSIKVSERFHFHRKHQTDFYYQIKAYQGYEDPNHGNIHNMGFAHRVFLGRHWDFLLGAEYSYRREKLNNQKYRFRNFYTNIIKKNLIRKTDLIFGYTTQYHEPRIPTFFQEARYYKADLKLERRLAKFWKAQLLYEYDRQRAKGVPAGGERRSFIRQSWGGGLTVIF